MGNGDIADDEWLLRRIPPWHLPQEVQNPTEGMLTTFRPPSAAFALDHGEAGLSFHLESSLRAAGEALTYGCPPAEPGWAVTRVEAAAIRRLGLEIVHDDLPHHILVFGLEKLKGSALRKMQREIAKLSVYVVEPRVA